MERWRLHQGSTTWVALVRGGPGFDDWAWYLHHPHTIRQAPEPADPRGPASW
ncbi:hypothetical protein ACIRRH_40330 [Kitasatospora sp. NPDC101235]|uniref:hypothetical protein n=1 Tax=Kitasatospora sp. NPDC101235 TaxID=3364101 RepID=UPI0038243471